MRCDYEYAILIAVILAATPFLELWLERWETWQWWREDCRTDKIKCPVNHSSFEQ